MFKILVIAVSLAAASPLYASAPTFNSERVLVVDRSTGRTLYSKEANVAVPIASVTKLMTAMVVLDEMPDMGEELVITADDVDTLKNASSRLQVGSRLTRREMLHLALMSSENRASHALARNSKKGLHGFIVAMNRKAQSLSMQGARFVDPTGLSPSNQASATDLAKLLDAAVGYDDIREYSTSPYENVRVGSGELRYRNSNPVVGRKGWNVLLQKTGFIREAGRCVVVGFEEAGRQIAVVLLGAGSPAAREQDLLKVRNWISGNVVEPLAKVTSKPLRVAERAGKRQAKATVSAVKKAKFTASHGPRKKRR